MVKEENTLKRVVLYLRYSSDRQQEQSITGQRRVCEDFCHQNNYEIVGEYIDKEKSAYKDIEKRENFLQMIEDSKKHTFDLVCVYSLDRFSRNKYDNAVYKTKLKQEGVRVVSATENITDDPQGIIMESLLEGMSQYYSMELSKKVKRGMKESALKGNVLGGALPLGYITKNKKYTIDENTSKIVKYIFSRYNEGYSLKSIRDDINKFGWKNQYNRNVSKTAITKCLTNRIYIGEYNYNGVVMENAIPKIIDKELFNKVSNKYERDKSSHKRKDVKELYNLTGKIFCECGAKMVGHSAYKNDVVHKYYVCQNRTHAKASCDMPYMKKETIENEIANSIKEILTDEFINYLAEMVVKKNDEINKNDEYVKGIENRITEIKQEKEHILDLLIADHSLIPELKPRLLAINDELEELEHMRNVAILKHKVITKDIVVWFLNRYKNGDVNDDEFKESLFTTLVNKVIVRKDKIDVYLNAIETKKNSTNESSNSAFMVDYKSSCANYYIVI